MQRKYHISVLSLTHSLQHAYKNYIIPNLKITKKCSNYKSSKRSINTVRLIHFAGDLQYCSNQLVQSQNKVKGHESRHKSIHRNAPCFQSSLAFPFFHNTVCLLLYVSPSVLHIFSFSVFFNSSVIISSAILPKRLVHLVCIRTLVDQADDLVFTPTLFLLFIFSSSLLFFPHDHLFSHTFLFLISIRQRSIIVTSLCLPDRTSEHQHSNCQHATGMIIPPLSTNL